MSLLKYKYIDSFKDKLGLNFMLEKLDVHKNSYMNYKLDRKQEYRENKDEIYKTIDYIYDTHNDGRKTFGYRMMKCFLEYYGYEISFATAHKYMNKDLGLYSTIFRRKQGYVKGEAHEIFNNLVKQNFKTNEKNNIWLTDFTYIKLTNGKMIYNCSILDLYDRFVVGYASSSKIDANLAVNALEHALQNEKIKGSIILHSDQGSQFTSKYFTDYCKSKDIIQSMSRAGKPYDNSPMERFFNTLKQEFVYKEKFESLDDFENRFKRYVNLWYNCQRPHCYNHYLSPFEKRNNVMRKIMLRIA